MLMCLIKLVHVANQRLLIYDSRSWSFSPHQCQSGAVVKRSFAQLVASKNNARTCCLLRDRVPNGGSVGASERPTHPEPHVPLADGLARSHISIPGNKLRTGIAAERTQRSHHV